MKYHEIRKKLRELEFQIEEQFGEIKEEQIKEFDNYHTLLKEKATELGIMLAETKYFDNEIDRISNKIEELKTEQNKLKRIKEFYTYKLAEQINESGNIKFEDNGIKKEITVGYTKRKKPIVEKIDRKKALYDVTFNKLTFDEMQQFNKPGAKIKLRTNVTEINPEAVKEELIPKIKIRKIR